MQDIGRSATVDNEIVRFGSVPQLQGSGHGTLGDMFVRIIDSEFFGTSPWAQGWSFDCAFCAFALLGLGMKQHNCPRQCG
jgi:hypothetical protein